MISKKVSEYDQEIPQSQKPETTPGHREEEPLNRLETPGKQIKQSNKLSKLFTSPLCNLYANIPVATCLKQLFET